MPRQAFDLKQEPAQVRERYGPSKLRQRTLLARRLIEHGVRLVLVGAPQTNTKGAGTHNGGAYPSIKKSLAETALLDDLRDCGLLESTVVLWMAEFGRSPQMSNCGGRVHWHRCCSFLMARVGIKGGQGYGSSNRLAAYPRDKPGPPEDIHATLCPLHSEGHDHPRPRRSPHYLVRWHTLDLAVLRSSGQRNGHSSRGAMGSVVQG